MNSVKSLQAVALLLLLGFVAAGSANGQATPSPADPPRSPPAPLWRQLGGAGGGLQRRETGSPIPLDTTEPKYQDYFNKVREKIKANWVYPGKAGEKGVQGDVQIEFHIAKDGRLEFIELQRSSGVTVLDDAALTALKLAQPFPPVPDDIAKQALSISSTFRYQTKGFGNRP